MPLPVFAYLAIPLGLGISVGIVAAIAAHREEVEEFLEEHTLIALKRITTAIEAQQAKRKVSVNAASESEDSATSTNFSQKILFTNERKSRGLSKKDIDYWLLSQEEEENDDDLDKAVTKGSSTGASSYVFASPVTSKSFAKAT